jgi:cobalt-zinc-cadmium efflux system outer membrane protein
MTSPMTHPISAAAGRFPVALLALLTLFAAHAQTAKLSIRLGEYLQAVEAGNLDLQSQREGVASARAGISVAGVRPDPQLTFGVVSHELYGPNKPNSTTPLTAGVALTIETGGKRDARIRAAQSNVRSTQAALDAAHDQALVDASAAFVEACRSREVLARKKASLRSLRDTVRANEVRFKAGDIGQLELRQSRVEAERFAVDVNAATADAEAALINLALPLGRPFDTVFAGAMPGCELRTQAAAPDLDAFVSQAMAQRRDVRAAQAAVDNARDAAALTRANRWVDPVVGVGLTNTPRINPVVDASGAVTNSPTLVRSLTLGLTVTVPIPLSRAQDGELRQAEATLTQAQLQLMSVLLKAQAEVRTIHSRFRAVAANEINYREQVLQESERVLEGARTSYRKGASSLLELLNAQRTADQIALDHLQAQADLANATVKLQVNAGMRPDL